MNDSRNRRWIALCVGAVLVASVLAACGSSAGSSSSTSASSSSGAASSASASSFSGAASSKASSASPSSQATSSASSSSAESGTSFRDSRTSTAPIVTDIPENSILRFDGDASSETLMKDMSAGKIPICCNVLYDTMGARPDVNVFDPDQIAELYNRLVAMTVSGESGMGITDSYHHIYFTLQNGMTVGFSFEGEGLLDKGKTTYNVKDSGNLWNMVQQIQDDYLDRVEKKGFRKITVAEGEDLIESCPTQAVPGDTVCIRTLGVTDAFMNVNVSGADAENWGDMFFLFTMPDQDVKVKAYVTTPPGGGLA